MHQPNQLQQNPPTRASHCQPQKSCWSVVVIWQ